MRGCSQITAGLALAAVQTGSVCPLFALRLGSVLFGGGGGGGSSSGGLPGTVVGAVVVVVLLMVLVGVVVVVVWSATVLHFASQLPVLPPEVWEPTLLWSLRGGGAGRGGKPTDGNGNESPQSRHVASRVPAGISK